MASKSTNTSNRSIKSPGNSERPVSSGQPSENSSPAPPHIKSSSHQSLLENEHEPLLGRSTAGKPSHRTFGVQPRSDSTDPNREDELAIDFESQFQRKLYGIQKKYRLFLNNSRWILNVFIILNTVWLVTTLISDFFFNINIFRTNNRDCSFSDLTLIFVSIIANTLNLWFNKIGLYSSLDYALNVTLCVLTLFNLALVYLISYTRRRIGFAGTFTYLWAAFSFFVGVIIDWFLYTYNRQLNEPYGHEQEDNRANRTRDDPFGISGKHTLTEWIYIGIRNLIKFLLLLFFVLFTFNTLLSAWDIHRVSRGTADVTAEVATYSAFHWVDKAHTYKLHVECYGDVFESNSLDDGEKRQPILLFEHGGLDTGFLSATWIQELYHLNRVQRYCTYERPGYGLSDSAPAPVSIAMVADALKHALLEEAKITGPFITIGYDMGGLFAQVFTAKNLDVVDGMMLVESWHEDLLLKNYLQRLLPPSRDGHNDPDDVSWLPPEIARPNEFKIWWDGLWSCWGVKLQTSWLFAHHGSRERIFGRDMKYQSKFLRAKFLESVTSSLLSYKDVLSAKEKLLDVKLSVVSSRELVKKSSQWGNWQRELTKLSNKAREWKIVEGGHEVYKYGLGKQQTQDVLLRLMDEKEIN
ncbi:YNL115C [Zygosaccharomyces parabailii]|nr:YNL115C [Zygosaccharomyces parabailii]